MLGCLGGLWKQQAITVWPRRLQPKLSWKQKVWCGRSSEREKDFWLIVEPQLQLQLQFGFRPGRRTVDQLLTFSCLLGTDWEFAIPVYMC